MDDKFYDENLGLELKIEEKIEYRKTFGGEILIIFLIVDNKFTINRKIIIPKTTYVTSKREQIEQFHWEDGYIKNEDIIKSNSFKKAGLIYEKDKLKSVTENDLLYATIELPDEGKVVNLSFKKSKEKWFLFDSEKKELEIKLTPKQLEKQLLKKIERFDTFEEKFEITFEKISLKVDESNFRFKLFFEVHSRIGVNLKDSVTIECILYDLEGSIIDSKSSGIYKDDFYGFILKDFSFYDDNVSLNVGSIRLYPKTY
jgi:hypothetical protein